MLPSLEYVATLRCKILMSEKNSVLRTLEHCLAERLTHKRQRTVCRQQYYCVVTV